MKKVMRNTVILLAFFVAAILFTHATIASKAAEATGIAGDANADSSVDVKDLVRGMRHKNDASVDISGDIDLNKNTVLSDDKDCKYLKVLLLGGEYKATTLTDAVKVGKYDNAAQTFEISIPDTVNLDENAQIDSAMIAGRDIGTQTYADGKVMLSSANLADREYKTLATAFVTGMEKVEVVTVPIDVYAMVINDETELNYMPTAIPKCPTGYYILGNDIYCTGTYTSNYNVEFKGTFNGLLHTIYNMNVVSGDTFSGGLFGFRFGTNNKTSALMQYVSFVNATYTGKGGFIASIMGGTLKDVYIDITMNSVDGTYINGSTVLGGYTYGGLAYKGVVVNYREPLAAGVTTGIPVYEMHHGYETYQGLYVIGADKINGENEAIEAADYCGAYLTETGFHNAVTAGTVNFSQFDKNYWKIQDGVIPMPHTLAYYVDPTLEDGVIADFTETNYTRNVKRGRATGTLPGSEVLNSYTDASGETANGVLKINPTYNVKGTFDFALRFGQRVKADEIESISVRLVQDNVEYANDITQTIFVSGDMHSYGWGTDDPFQSFTVAEDDWTTITIDKETLLTAAAADGYIYSLSFFCDAGQLNTSEPAAIYIDEVYYTLKDTNSSVKVGVLSDVHFVDSNNGARETNLRKALLYYRKNGADVIIMNGDVSDMGTVTSYQNLVKVIKGVYPDESARPTIISTADNHEYYDAWSWANRTGTYTASQETFLTNYANAFGQTTMNTSQEINGYQFISVSADTAQAYNTSGVLCDGLAGYSDDTKTWLEEEIAAAAAKDATKPIFVAVHQPPMNTVTSSSEHGNAALTEIFEKYSQVVVFSSHTHSSIKQENSIDQDKYTVVNTGSLYYVGGDEMNYVNTGNAADYLLHAYNFGEGLLVSVANNQVSIERRDFFWGGKIKTDWVFDTTNGTDGFVYTDARKENRVAPTFAVDAQLSIAKYTTDYQWSSLIKASAEDSVILTFPSAMHDDFVQYYTVVVKDASGNAVTLKRLGTGNDTTSSNYVSDFYWGIDKMAATQELVVKGLTPGETYTFEVRAVETFGNTSEALTGTFTFE